MPLKKKISGGNCPSGFICFDNTTILMLIIIILIIIIAFLYYRQPYNQPVEKSSIKYEEPSTYGLPSEKIYVVDERPSLFDYRYWYPSSYWYPSRYGSNYYDNRTTHYHNENNHKPKPNKPKPRQEQPIPRQEQPIAQPEQFILNPEKDINTSSLALSEPVVTVKNEMPLQLPSRNEPVIMNKEPVVKELENETK